MLKPMTVLAVPIVGLSLTGTPASAQDPPQMYACAAQTELLQTLDGTGAVVPERCRTLTVSVLVSEGRQLCLLELGERPDVLGQIRDLVGQDQLWVSCDLLAARVGN